VTFDEMEAAVRARLEALPPAARAELIHCSASQTSTAPTASAISGATRRVALCRLLIDCEDRTLRAVLVGMLWDMKRRD
jgi:hypothetical protein